MSDSENQAAGLNKLFAVLTPPPIEHDAEIRRNQHIIDTLRAIQPHMQAMGDALQDVEKVIAKTEADRIAEYVADADLVQCKKIIYLLIERVSTITGCAHELEDASCVLAREIEAEEGAENGLRSYVDGRDEALITFSYAILT